MDVRTRDSNGAKTRGREARPKTETDVPGCSVEMRAIHPNTTPE